MQSTIPGEVGTKPTGNSPSTGNKPPYSGRGDGLKMAFDSAMLAKEGFVATVSQAAEQSGSEFLFDLPASGLTEDCSQIAVLRHVMTGNDDLVLIVKLGEDGETISVNEPDETMKDLVVFARAFINLLSKL